jgi:hypothetical protein
MSNPYIKIEQGEFNEEEYKTLVEYWTRMPDARDSSLAGGMNLRRRRYHKSRLDQYERYRP